MIFTIKKSIENDFYYKDSFEMIFTIKVLVRNIEVMNNKNQYSDVM